MPPREIKLIFKWSLNLKTEIVINVLREANLEPKDIVQIRNKDNVQKHKEKTRRKQHRELRFNHNQPR